MVAVDEEIDQEMLVTVLIAITTAAGTLMGYVAKEKRHL